jgi:hypothetical protein
VSVSPSTGPVGAPPPSSYQWVLTFDDEFTQDTSIKQGAGAWDILNYGCCLSLDSTNGLVLTAVDPANTNRIELCRDPCGGCQVVTNASAIGNGVRRSQLLPAARQTVIIPISGFGHQPMHTVSRTTLLSISMAQAMAAKRIM